MKILFWLIVAGIVLLSMFAAANWSLFTAPASLNFLAFAVEAPVGLILLGATFILIALFAIYVLWMRTTTLMVLRRNTKELDAQRAVAAGAESTRIAELRAQLEAEAARHRASIEAAVEALTVRIDALDQSLVASMNDATNSLAAYVGQVDDKLDRLLSPPGSESVQAIYGAGETRRITR
jgi:uncharacterized integral membrane protein